MYCNYIMMHVYNSNCLLHVCNEISSLHVLYISYAIDYQEYKAVYVMM